MRGNVCVLDCLVGWRSLNVDDLDRLAWILDESDVGLVLMRIDDGGDVSIRKSSAS